MAARDDEPVSAEGTSLITIVSSDGSERLCANRLAISLVSAEPGVTVGPLRGAGELVPADTRDGRLTLYNVMAAMRRQAYRNSPPNAVPKEAQTRRRPPKAKP